MKKLAIEVADKDKLKFKKLTDWMKLGGACREKVEIRHYAENFRGVHAACDIREGEIVLFVPLKLILKKEDVGDTDIGL